MRIDPRIIRRRLEVAEYEARRRVRRSLVLLAGLGCVAWFFVSPLMSVRSVVVDGAHRAPVEEILSGEKVVEGRPLVAIRVGTVEEHLVADPWIESASVKVVFPTRVEVNVREREPVAWIRLDNRWGLLADDGVLVEYADSPVPVRSLIRIPVEDPGLGVGVENENVFGVLQFLDALPDALARRSVAKDDRRRSVGSGRLPIGPAGASRRDGGQGCFPACHDQHRPPGRDRHNCS